MYKLVTKAKKLLWSMLYILCGSNIDGEFYLTNNSRAFCIQWLCPYNIICSFTIARINVLQTSASVLVYEYVVRPMVYKNLMCLLSVNSIEENVSINTTFLI